MRRQCGRYRWRFFYPRGLHHRLLSEAGAAKHGSSLRWPERNGCVLTAFGAFCPGLAADLLLSVRAPCIAPFAALGVVFELFIVEEQLFARRKHKLGGAVDTRQYSIGEIHGCVLQ